MNNTQTVNVKELVERIDYYVSTTYKESVYRARMSASGMIRLYQLKSESCITNTAIEALKRDYNLVLVSVDIDTNSRNPEEKGKIYALFEIKESA